MYSRILLPNNGVDLTTQAIRAAEHLAVHWDCELHILAVVEGTQIEPGIRDGIDSQVTGIRPPPKVDVRSVSVTVPQDIATEADRIEDTLIVMATRGRGRSAGVASNMSEDVLRLVHRPMMVVGAEADIASDWPNGPMLIATDGSEFGESIALDAAKLAKAMEIEPRLVTVIESGKRSHGVSSGTATNSLRGLAGLVEGVTGREVRYDVLHGSDPAHKIADYARQQQASVIAMSTHGRSGMARVASGSVAMDVVRNAGCPVILNRPALAEPA